MGHARLHPPGRQRLHVGAADVLRHFHRRRNSLAGREHGIHTTTSPRSRSSCNPDAKWSDGTPVTAEGRGLHVRRASSTTTSCRITRQFDQFVDTIESPDDLTVDREVQDPGAALQVRGADAQVRYRHSDRARARAVAAGRRQRLRRRHRDAALRPLRPRRLGREPEDLRPARGLVGDQGRPDRQRRPSSASSSSTSAARSARTWTPSPSASSTTSSTPRSTCAASVIGNILAQNAEDHHAYRQRVALRLPRLVAELAVGEHPARAVQRRQGPPRASAWPINRDPIDEILYEGAKIATIYPFPLYPGLQAFADRPEVKALEEKYQPRQVRPRARAPS